MPKKELFGKCPYVTTQKVLKGKWSMYILYLLSTQEPIRFNELQRRMAEEMTHTTLSRQLKALEDEGLVIRKEYSQIPPKVEYSLSDIGKKFEKVLKAIG
ncbi:MAG: helix-turn-helix domain-containing protein [Lachnospiraceae bacterium]|nr:helix-turn-helix domain-containing protein [Lachnospiraceae bacterium]